MAKNDSDVLVISVPYLLKADARKRLHESFVKQRESGVIVITSGMEVKFVPKDTKIVVKDSDGNIEEE